MEVLELLTLIVADITPEHDSKMQYLYGVINDKIEHPINIDNKKIIIFTAFADTATYLYKHVSGFMTKHSSLQVDSTTLPVAEQLARQEE